MREIKFRGLSYNGSFKKDVWRYGGLTENKTGYSIRSRDYKGFYGYLIKRIDTIGQFTGLQDKNGKDIYEGDIVTHKVELVDGSFTEEIKGAVYFKRGCYYVESNVSGRDGEYHKALHEVVSEFNPEFSCEIIGNVHENEL